MFLRVVWDSGIAMVDYIVCMDLGELLRILWLNGIHVRVEQRIGI